MKNTPVWFYLALLVIGSVGIIGCSGGSDESAANQELIDKYNKNLPPFDPNAPVEPEPTRPGDLPAKGKG